METNKQDEVLGIDNNSILVSSTKNALITVEKSLNSIIQSNISSTTIESLIYQLNLPLLKHLAATIKTLFETVQLDHQPTLHSSNYNNNSDMSTHYNKNSTVDNLVPSTIEYESTINITNDLNTHNIDSININAFDNMSVVSGGTTATGATGATGLTGMTGITAATGATGGTTMTKLTGVSSIAPAITMDDPLIVIMGIGKYKGLSDLAGVIKDYENLLTTFVKEWKYKIFYQLENNNIVYTNNINQLAQNDEYSKYKLEWNGDEIELFVEQARKHVVKNKHNGLIFAISSHGDTGKVLYDSECEKYELDCIFSMFSPEGGQLLESYKETEMESNHLFKIPKIFFLDMCRGDYKAKVTNININTTTSIHDENTNDQQDISDDHGNGVTQVSFDHITSQNNSEHIGAVENQTPSATTQTTVEEQKSNTNTTNHTNHEETNNGSSDNGLIVTNHEEIAQDAKINENHNGCKNDIKLQIESKNEIELQHTVSDHDAGIVGVDSVQIQKDGVDDELFVFKTVSKEKAETLVSQMSNFCKVYANVDGFSVADGSLHGGIFLRNVCKLFQDKNFVLKHKWNDIIFKLREYTKRDATLHGELFNFTQIIENEGTLEKQIRFGSKYLKLSSAHNHQLLQSHLAMLDELNDIDHDNVNSQHVAATKLMVINGSKQCKIAVLVEMEQIRENREDISKLLIKDSQQNNFQSFIEKGFVIIDNNGGSHRFDKVWDEVYITAYQLDDGLNSNSSHLVQNVEIYDRRMFFDDDLYFSDGQFHRLKDKIPNCYKNICLYQDSTDEQADPHQLKRIEVNQQNIQDYAGLDECGLCSLRIDHGNRNYYCTICNQGLCSKCCVLINCGHTALGLFDAPTVTKVNQIESDTMEIVCQLPKRFLYSGKSRQNCRFEIKSTIAGADETNNGKIVQSCYVNCDKKQIDPYTLLSVPLTPIDDIEKEFKETTLEYSVEIRICDTVHSLYSSFSPACQTLIQIDSNGHGKHNLYQYQCTFTTLNGRGRFGPTTIDEYKSSGTNKNNCHFNDTTLELKKKSIFSSKTEPTGIQIWKIPKSGQWKIQCYGAKGGDSKWDEFSLFGGKGAKVGGIINLFKDDLIKIICGQIGITSENELIGGGGGGATYFVLYKTGSKNVNYKKNKVVNIPLIIASGGHGACAAFYYKTNGIDGLCNSSENRYNYGGYFTTGQATRGASFRNDFDNFKSFIYRDDDYNKCNPLCFLDGAIGGQGYSLNNNNINSTRNTCDGGFGGGGGSHLAGGAGGGYIGGVVSPFDLENKYDANMYAKYGALSFNSCIDNDEKIMLSGYNNSNGRIQVRYIGSSLHLK